MSATNAALIKAVERELQHYPGVESEVANGGTHKRIVFRLGERSRFMAIPKTPSDWRSTNNAVAVARKTMRELGAQRIDILPGQTKGRRKNHAVARFSLNKRTIAITIPAQSPLIDRFRTATNEPTGFWSFELRASPDLEAPPFLALKKVGFESTGPKKHGLIRGFFQPNTLGWRLGLTRAYLSGLPKSIKEIKSVDVEVYQDNGDELVFKLPTGTLPTSFRAKAKVEQQAPAPAPAAKIEPVELPPPPAAPEAAPAPKLGDHPMVLQLPKPSISVEQAVGILNKAKARCGNNLRFTVTEGGFLAVTHRIGF
jgi:hypothetical protein